MANPLSLSYGLPGSGDDGSGAVAASSSLSLEDIEKNELALKAEVFSKIERVDIADGAGSGTATKGSGITAEHLFVQLRNLVLLHMTHCSTRGMH